MPIIDGYMCKGYVPREDGSLICIEDDMTEEERREFFQKVRNRLADAILEVTYNKELRKMRGGE